MPAFSAKKMLSYLVLVILVGVLTWANWREPHLHEFVAPVAMRIVRLENLQTPAQAAALETQVRALPGVTACQVQLATQTVIVSFHPAALPATALRQTLAAGGTYRLTSPPRLAAAGAAGPQCPVPLNWLTKLDRLRFALNFRRLFVAV